MKPAQYTSHLFLGRHAYFRREVLRLAGWQAVLLMQNRSIEWFLRALARMGAVRFVATRTFFALGGSRFCVTSGNYVMAFFSFSVFKQSLLCLVVIFSPMLVSCCRLIVFFRGCVSLL